MSSMEETPSRPQFVSWRWRLMLPLFIVILTAAMVSGYVLARVNGIDSAPAADSSLFAVASRQQLTALLFALLAASAVITAFLIVNWMLGRVSRVTRVAQALAEGHMMTRTGMTATDEIGALGAALDRYADYVQEHQDMLRTTLRRQRRELEHLSAVLEALPEGVIVQDVDGRAVLVNHRARELLGSQQDLSSGDLNALTAAVTDILGPSLAPGLYSLGDPQRVELDGRMLSAQAAAILSVTNLRVGTVIILRDITDEVRRARAHDELMRRMTHDVQSPLLEIGRAGMTRSAAPMSEFARDITRHAGALQKLIVEMRELTAEIDTRDRQRVQRPLLLETLIWAVANEWRQVAQAANLSLQVQIQQSGLHVLGEERRLRWAVGNIVDNAIKYTPPGGTITLEIRGEAKGMALLRIRDNGVGIAADELSKVFTRFFRGTPTTRSGRAIHVPGTGQGLSIAKQIVEAHGGSIGIKSAQGVGTAVYIGLPLTASVSLELPNAAVDMEGETVQLEIENPTLLNPRK